MVGKGHIATSAHVNFTLMSRLPPLPLMKETIERLKDEMCNEMATWTMDAAAPLFYVMDETVVMETILLPRLHSRLFFFFPSFSTRDAG